MNEEVVSSKMELTTQHAQCLKKHKEKNLGLTSWKNYPTGDIRISDVSIPKNY